MKKTKTNNTELSDILGTLGKQVADFYDEQLRNQLASGSLCNRKIIGWKNVKVPRYLEITIPIIKKHYEYDDYGEFEQYEGLLITTKKIKLFRIGTKTEEEPIYEKHKKGKTISFTRYHKL